MNSVRVKICGLRSVNDIEIVNKYLPDYVGFVFADFSKRYIDFATAGKLKTLLDLKIKAVGVFVNEDPEKIISLLDDGVIDIAQLHGAEDEGYIRYIKEKSGKPVIKAFNMNKPYEAESIENSPADYILLDSGSGTGKTFDWTKPESIRRPYFLAGGLSPDNVAEAVKKLHPFAVDVSSGVEMNGIKDETLIRRFFNELI